MNYGLAYPSAVCRSPRPRPLPVRVTHLRPYRVKAAPGKRADGLGRARRSEAESLDRYGTLTIPAREAII